MNLYFSTGAAGKLKRKVDTMLEKVFKLSENKTTVKTEVVAGLTTFMTMAYIIALNPNLLTGFGAAGTACSWQPASRLPSVRSAWRSWPTSPSQWLPVWV